MSSYGDHHSYSDPEMDARYSRYVQWAEAEEKREWNERKKLFKKELPHPEWAKVENSTFVTNFNNWCLTEAAEVLGIDIKTHLEDYKPALLEHWTLHPDGFVCRHTEFTSEIRKLI
ncbi:hypothetical protein C4577_05230 [Candidatus Parcubacteria bacterium]|nr:MAG: hypothetical protein C4577_05230 [Candidatus Parcubacteria bacterium]